MVVDSVRVELNMAGGQKFTERMHKIIDQASKSGRNACRLLSAILKKGSHTNCEN